ncbi:MULTISPECIES: AAA family ATPase [Sphingomonas]|uniref:Exopolysaccharide biosynthesis protein n=1 Tax=Sphingomonas hankookensis TaxID=563996 RepID=A0ABR5YGJ3_9SPHN|nr:MULTISPECIES: AAA family ATPase [Sphingomonas]KZE18834.1 exopolysaccharide biosynthesis protein [Sphingomonas hankookensis]PZT93743.1 MAG: exopolysaccharide biosynthesis protein [Sphingomonas sp.]RSV23399.1 exopolysaccharide biosynthesis protein [Sphingomonas sp. ABOLH]WCP70738.1 AAA family ATPase [Sphingomonas hankookensis]
MRASLLERAADRWQLGPKPELPPVAMPDLPPPPPPVAAKPAARKMPPARIRPFDPARIDRERLAEAGMLVPGGPVTALAEEFRLVKRQLLTTAADIEKRDPQAARMVLVCSAQPGDGKTFCAINLALSLAAERDLQILLVDADFPKPDILDRLGIAASGQGLLDALGDPAIDVEALVIPTDVPQLSVLPAGKRTNADTELLRSDHAQDVLERLLSADPDRIVIFDSPPALAASPAAVLASLVGQTVLVVRADRSSESDLREAVALLDGCDDIQLLLNATTYRAEGARFGYYGQDKE